MDALTRGRRVAAGALVVVAGCVVPALPSDAGPAGTAAAPADGCAATQAQQVLARVNEIRAGRGLPALAPEAHLAEAAAAHSADQARNRVSGHLGSDRSTVGERVRRAGYRWRVVAENVAQGYPTPRAVVAGWMDSPPHRATILSPEPSHAGVGYAAGPPDMRHFWTLNVAAPAAGGSVSPLTCHP